jgi:propanol-preferring alcohol dehydrogenase
MGAEVIAVDVAEDKLALATALGATRTLNAGSSDVARELRRMGGVHVALVTSAAKAAYDTAFRCLRPTGTLLVVGLPAENICFPPLMMAASEARIRASAVGTRQELREVLALAEAGKVQCQVTTRSLSEVNSAMDELERGRVMGRVVLTLLQGA